MLPHSKLLGIFCCHLSGGPKTARVPQNTACLWPKELSELFSKCKENRGLKAQKCFYLNLSEKPILEASSGNMAVCKKMPHTGALSMLPALGTLQTYCFKVKEVANTWENLASDS